MEANSVWLNKMARIAGLLYLMWTFTGLFALIYVPSQIATHGDAATSASSILANETLFRVSIVNSLVSCIIWIVMVLVFYRMFRHVDERHAGLLVALVMVQIPAVFFMGALNIGSLMILKGEVLKTFDLAQRQDIAHLFSSFSDHTTVLLETFWGLWLFPLSVLVYKCGFLPRFLGVWLAITGVFYVVLSFTGILLPEYTDAVLNSPIALPIELSELAFTLWLLIRGAKERAARGELVR